MPNNFLSTDRPRNLADRVAAKAPAGPLRDRLAKLVFEALVTDPANARRARQNEIEGGPAWAQRTCQPVHVFVLRRASRERLELLIGRLMAFHRAYRIEGFPGQALLGRLIHQCPRMPLEIIEQRLDDIHVAWDRYAAERAAAHAAREHEPLCDAGQLTCDSGFAWVRVQSRAELNECGQALRNCCRRGTNMYDRFCEAMAATYIEFWALRGGERHIVGLALINRRTWAISEARAFGNRALHAHQQELESLEAFLIPLRRRAQAERSAANSPSSPASPPSVDAILALLALADPANVPQIPGPPTPRLQSPN